MTDVFISYSTRSPVYADMIEEDLERDGYSCWRDRSNLRGGDKWKKEIQNAIRQSTIIVVLVTKSALRSRWIKFEVEFAESLSKPRIPLIMEDLKNIGEMLQKLGLGEDQAINFVTDRRRVAYAHLLERIKKYTDEWLQFTPNIQNLSHFSTHVRLKAMNSLADTGDYRVLPHLFEALRVEDQQEIIKHLFTRLGEFNHPEVLLSAIQTYQSFHEQGWLDYNREIREIALKIITKLAPTAPGIEEILLSWLDKYMMDIPRISQILKLFDSTIRKRAVEKLVARISAEPRMVRVYAKLCKWNAPGV